MDKTINKNKYRRILIITILLLLSSILPIFGLYYGGNGKSITFEDINNFILHQTTGNNLKDILIREVRLPPIIGAILLGLTLSASGLMLQTLFRNILADPYTTGISSGILLVASLIILTDSFSSLLEVFGSNKLVIAGWCGALFSTIVLLIVALRVKESNGVIIVSLLISYLFGGIRSYLISNAKDMNVMEYWGYVVGSLFKIKYNDLPILILSTIIFIILLLFLIKPLNALLFGENYAKSFGLDIKKVRVLVLLTSSFIVGAIVPFVGLIGFIGIASAYLARPLIGTSDHRYLLPTTMLVGVILMLICHIISLKYFLPLHYIYGIDRPGSPLPIGAVLDILGGLLVIYLVHRGEKKLKLDI